MPRKEWRQWISLVISKRDMSQGHSTLTAVSSIKLLHAFITVRNRILRLMFIAGHLSKSRGLV